MASFGHPSAAATGVARAQQLKDQLYDSNAKLNDLFGDLEPKLMLDAIIDTYCKALLPAVTIVVSCMDIFCSLPLL